MPSNCITNSDIDSFVCTQLNDGIEVLSGGMNWYDYGDTAMTSPRPWWYYPSYWQHPQREIMRDITGEPYPYSPQYCRVASLLQAEITAINALHSWSFEYDGSKTAEENARALLKYALANWDFEN